MTTLLTAPTAAQTQDVSEISYRGTLIALIVRATFHKPGIHFLTSDLLTQQLACMSHPRGKIVAPHVHNRMPRTVYQTLEVLFIRSGRLRVDLYTQDTQYLESHNIGPGDTLLLADGGHGFEVLEDVEMLEVKQGPYPGEGDKTRFIGIAPDYIILKD